MWWMLCSAGAAAGVIRKHQSQIQSPSLLSASFFQLLVWLGFFGFGFLLLFPVDLPFSSGLGKRPRLQFSSIGRRAGSGKEGQPSHL